MLGAAVLVGAFSTSRMVEFLEDIDVNAERLEGVDGSIVGEGGRRTSATSSKSVSVILNNNRDLTRGEGKKCESEGEAMRLNIVNQYNKKSWVKSLWILD